MSCPTCKALGRQCSGCAGEFTYPPKKEYRLNGIRLGEEKWCPECGKTMSADDGGEECEDCREWWAKFGEVARKSIS